MATSGPRAAKSGLSKAISIPGRLRQSGVRSEFVDTSTQLFQQRLSLRLFSTTYRYAATPAPTYVRKPIEPKEPPKAKSAPIDDVSPIKDMTSGLADEPLILDEGTRQVDWTRSFHGLSSQPFSKEAADTLLAPIPFDDVEVKPDGIIYLPEIKYRRILNKAFGPGGWGLAPRGETIVTGKSVTREYALIAHGRLVSVSRGEQDYFAPEDLGVASELWDPRYIRTFMKEKAKQVWVEHVLSKKKKQIWLRKDDDVRYPYKESRYGA